MATKRTNTRRDFTQVALDVVRQATGEQSPIQLTKTQVRARTAGLKGGQARAVKLAPKERREIALKGAAARWLKKTGSEPQPDEESAPASLGPNSVRS